MFAGASNSFVAGSLENWMSKFLYTLTIKKECIKFVHMQVANRNSSTGRIACNEVVYMKTNFDLSNN